MLAMARSPAALQTVEGAGLHPEKEALQSPEWRARATAGVSGRPRDSCVALEIGAQDCATVRVGKKEISLQGSMVGGVTKGKEWTEAGALACHCHTDYRFPNSWARTWLAPVNCNLGKM